jgi:hypothetical protein
VLVTPEGEPPRDHVLAVLPQEWHRDLGRRRVGQSDAQEGAAYRVLQPTLDLGLDPLGERAALVLLPPELDGTGGSLPPK